MLREIRKKGRNAAFDEMKQIHDCGILTNSG